MNKNDETVCKNCGEPIRESRTAFGYGWTHVDGIEFTGYRYCRNAVAEPEGVSS